MGRGRKIEVDLYPDVIIKTACRQVAAVTR